MGNKQSHGVNPVSEDDGESTSQKIEYTRHEAKLIENPNPSYEGYLIEKQRKKGKLPVVIRTPLRTGNSEKVVIWVYYYKVIRERGSEQEENGTYVVLKFEASGNFFFAKDASPPQKLRLKQTGFDPKNPEDITTTDDPRVFLMQTRSSDLVFASCYNKSKGRVITLPEKNTAAQLLPEGNGPLDAETFKLHSPKLRRSTDPDFLEPLLPSSEP